MNHLTVIEGGAEESQERTYGERIVRSVETLLDVAEKYEEENLPTPLVAAIDNLRREMRR